MGSGKRLGTLLGPEGSGHSGRTATRLAARLVTSATGAVRPANCSLTSSRQARITARHRPYLENCTVDASICAAYVDPSWVGAATAHAIESLW